VVTISDGTRQASITERDQKAAPPHHIEWPCSHGVRSGQILEDVVQVGIRFKAVGTGGAHEGKQFALARAPDGLFAKSQTRRP